MRSKSIISKFSKYNEANHRELRLYLTDISKIPLLTTSQERALGFRIRNGDTEAVTELVRSNLRFVVKIAKAYAGRGLSLLDLINEGNVGMINAALRFDPAKNTKFITYAVWWVRESIVHALANLENPLKLPIGICNKLRKLEAILRKKNLELGRIPTIEEVAAEAGIGVLQLTSILRLGQYVYLSHAINGEDDLEFVEALKASGFGTDPIATILHKQIHRILAELSSQEEKVLKLRYGIEDEMTLQQIGDLLGLSRERIRQIERTALKKCKARLRA